MKNIKIFLSVIFLLFFAFIVSPATPIGAQTTDCMSLATADQQMACLTVLINDLTAQVLALQTQPVTTATETAWCHNFNTDLGYAQSGSEEVGYLHTALQKQGISYAPDTGNTYYTGTSQGVIAFQAKYDIYQSGYLGERTRGQLNILYGCMPISNSVSAAKNISSFSATEETASNFSASIISPSGGENLIIGESTDIKFSISNDMPGIEVALKVCDATGCGDENTGGAYVIASFVQNPDYGTEGESSEIIYHWRVGDVTNNQGMPAPAGNYKLELYYYDTINRVDVFGGMFSIGASGETPPVIPPDNPPSATTCTSWDYTSWTPATCPASGIQTRTITSSYPAGCIGGNPVLSQSCAPSSQNTCTSFIYSDWTPATCPASGVQTHTVIDSYPVGCSGGTPATTQNCTPPVCAVPSGSSIKVCYPAGGESWLTGESHNIFWGSTLSGTLFVDIFLINTATSAQTYIAHTLPVLQGTYPWIIPAGTTPGIYKIRIQNTSTTYVDSATFNVVEPCSDTDSGTTYPTGINYYLSGSATGLYNGVKTTKTDSCSGSVLTEYSCNSDKKIIDTQSVNCTNGCLSGACVGTSPAPVSTSSTWCHTFNTDLGYAQSGTAEVGELHTALQKQGISYAPDTGNTYYTGTSQGVIAFQARYGIYQSGYVAELTRAKLNSLYGCTQISTTLITQPPVSTPATSQISPQSQGPITVVSPNGSEAFEYGAKKDIKWVSTGVSNVKISLIFASQQNKEYEIATVPASSGTYTWTVGYANTLYNYAQPGQYKVKISDSVNSSVYDQSDNYFSVVLASTGCTDSDNGINYYVKGTTTGINSLGGAITATDYCNASSASLIEEYSCNSGYLKISEYSCPNGCQNGSCLPASNTTISVTAPVGGEQLQAGSYKNITWTAQSGVSSVNINLKGYPSASAVTRIATVLASAGTYSWRVGETISGTAPAGSQYKIEIANASNAETIPALSNNYFSIIGTATCTDSDSGKIYNTKGTTTGLNYSNQFATSTDYCFSSTDIPSNTGNFVREYFCSADNKTLNTEFYACASGCENGACKQVVVPPIITEIPANLKVLLASDTPVSQNYTYNQQGVSLAKFKFENLGSSTIKITQLKLKTIGVATNTTISKVHLFYNGVELSAVNMGVDGVAYFNNYAGIFFVAPNFSSVVEARADLNGQAGQTISLAINSANDVILSPDTEKAGGVFPVAGNLMKLVAPSIAQSVRVLTPNGGETLTQGNIYNITWTATGLDTVGIIVADYSQSSLNGQGVNMGYGYSVINSVPASSGFYPWTVPTTFLGSKYKIEVYDTHNYTVMNDYSDNYFSIIARPVQPFIKVVSPNGGETFNAGQSVNIQWDLGNLSNYQSFTISLLDYTYSSSSNSIMDWNLPISTVEDKNYTITLPANISGSKYMIKVRLVTGAGAYEDPSNNYFGIGQAGGTATVPLAITSPNGGEQWIQGRGQTVTWQASSELANLNISIYLTNPSGVKSLIRAPLLASAGSFSWTVPSTVTPSTGGSSTSSVGANYKLLAEIRDPATYALKASDYSDNYFSITSATTANISENSLASISDAINKILAELKILMGQ